MKSKILKKTNPILPNKLLISSKITFQI